MKRISKFAGALYLFLTVLLFYLLFISRSDEVYTVWQFMHPAFMPTFFATTALLVAIILSPGKAQYKLFFIMIHSFLSHSFFIIIFPAGNIGFQQTVLGKTRLIFDNIAPHGYGGTAENVLKRIYNMFDEGNFQSVYSVSFARMLSVDVLWSHLLLAPILWGIFIPTITFMIAKALGGNERISTLTGLLGSAFPLLIYMGSLSVPNSVGFVFFLGSLFFFLKYLTSSELKYTYLMLLFTFASFLSHFLTGFLSLALLLLVLSVRKYETEKSSSPSAVNYLLVTSFLLSTSILPLALVYRRIFLPPSVTYFSLDKIYRYTPTDFLAQFLLGDYLNYPPQIALVHVVGPLIGFIWIIYNLYITNKQRPNDSFRTQMLFLLLGLLMLWLDYRILKFFMTNVPFNEERIWIFRDLLSAPLVVFALDGFIAFSRCRISQITFFTSNFLSSTIFSRKVKRSRKAGTSFTLGSFLVLNILFPAVLAGWITLSVYCGYPHSSPLQTTPYELEAVRYIDKTTNKNYIVICDLWTALAGHMIVGVYNPTAYYFSANEAEGVTLFMKMKDNPSPEVMIEATHVNNATIAYFIVTEPRLGTEEFHDVVSRALQNPQITVAGIFGDGKLYVFSYREGEGT